MSRTPKICGWSGTPKCLQTATVRGRCKTHEIPPYAGAKDRWKANRPSNWPAIRRAVIRRASGRCEVLLCNSPGAEVDKIVPDAEGGTWTLDNAQYLCKPCHVVKTEQDAQRGRQRRRR